MNTAVWLAAVLLALAGTASAKPGDLTVTGAVVRASLGTVPTSAAYLTIANAGDRPDTLLSIDCGCAQMTMMHKTEIKAGVASMDMVATVTVPAHGKVSFSPTGLHIMLMGVKAPLKSGGTVPMTLTFEHAGAVKAAFKVQDVIDKR